MLYDEHTLFIDAYRSSNKNMLHFLHPLHLKMFQQTSYKILHD